MSGKRKYMSKNALCLGTKSQGGFGVKQTHLMSTVKHNGECDSVAYEE